MWTHPIFESDFDCLTDQHTKCLEVQTLRVTRTRLTPMETIHTPTPTVRPTSEMELTPTTATTRAEGGISTIITRVTHLGNTSAIQTPAARSIVWSMDSYGRSGSCSIANKI